MFPVDNWPYTNLHELNLDWVLNEIKKLQQSVDEIDDKIAEQISIILQSLPSTVEITPQMYGAKGDGVANDGPALTNWLKFIVANGRNGYIPNGRYLSNGMYYRQGANTTRWSIRGESMNAVLVQDSSQLPILDFRELSGGTISTLTLEGLGLDGQKTGSAIYLVDVNNMTFRNIDCTNCARSGVLVYASSYRGTCDNNLFDNVNIYGVTNTADFGDGRQLYPMGWILTNCTNTIVKNGVVTNCKWYGLEFKTFCRYSAFINMTVINCTTACHIGGEFQGDDTVGVRDCFYKNITCVNTARLAVGSAFDNVIFDVCATYSETPKEPFIRFGANTTNAIVNVDATGLNSDTYIPVLCSDNSEVIVNGTILGTISNRITNSDNPNLKACINTSVNIIRSTDGPVVASNPLLGVTRQMGSRGNLLFMQDANNKLEILNRYDTQNTIDFTFTENGATAAIYRLDKKGFTKTFPTD